VPANSRTPQDVIEDQWQSIGAELCGIDDTLVARQIKIDLFIILVFVTSPNMIISPEASNVEPLVTGVAESLPIIFDVVEFGAHSARSLRSA
jgi:hypothetical protein